MNLVDIWFPPPARPFLRKAALALYLGVLTWLCFHRWSSDVLFGDDLANYRSYAEGVFFRSLPQDLFGGFEEKYRPVYALAMTGIFELFGPRMQPVFWVDLGLNVLCGLLVARIAFLLSGRRVLVGVLAATMTVTSRFLLYQATELTSVIEAIGYALFLTMLAATAGLYAGPAAERGRGAKLTVLAVAAAWLLVLDHERYLAAIPWLAVMLWAAPARRETPLLVRAWPPLAVLASAAFDVGYKALLLKQRVMVGTGGSRMTLDIPADIDRAGQALLSLFAFNHGPAYLVGRDLLAPPHGLLVLTSAVFVAIFAALLVLGLMARGREAASSDKRAPVGLLLPVALAVLAAMILVPPILTIRMEQRWLVEPFALLVLVGAWAAGRLADRRRVAAIGLFAAWTAASLAVDAGLSRAFPDIFFIAASQGAEQVEHGLLQRLPATRPVVLVASSDVCGWTLDNGQFYKVYAPARPPFGCVSDIGKIDPAIYAPGARPEIFAIVRGQPLQDISDFVYGDQTYAGETRRLEFLDLFDRGQINDPRPVQTPSGRGVLRFPLYSLPGIAVVTGYSYRFDHIPVQPGDRLEFEAAMALPTKDRGRARVTVQGADGKPVVVFADLVPLRPASGPPALTRASIPLDRFGREVSVTFAAETPAGADPAAQWVEYVRPRIAASTAPR